MDLSIVILNYKSKNLVKYCLKGITSQPLPGEHEIIVVDNNSKDGVDKMLNENFPHVKFLTAPTNGGFAAGNNLGLRRARGRYVLMLNPDIVILDNAIAKLYNFMEARPEAALAGPRLNNPDGTLQHSCYRFPNFLTPLYRRTFLGQWSIGQKSLTRYLMADDDHALNKEVDWLLGACLMVRRQAMAEVGLLDERFFLYFEDVDWCRRFWRAGYKVYYVPEAKMVHYHHRQSAEGGVIGNILNRSSRVHITSAIKYFWKYRRDPNRLPASQPSILNF